MTDEPLITHPRAEDPPTLEALLGEALGHHQAGRFEPARQLYHLVLARDGRHADCLHLLGVLLAQTGHASDAADLIRQAVALKPTSAVYRLNLGRILRQSGAFDAAVDCYRTALTMAPDMIELWIGLADSLLAAGRQEEAIDAYHHVIRLAPGDLATRTNLGNLLMQQGRLEAAIGCYEAVLALDATYHIASINLAVALEKQGNPEAAVAVLTRVLQADPQSVDALYTLAVARSRLGADGVAIEIYRQILGLSPTHVRARNNLGHALLARGDRWAAIDCFRAATGLDPTDPQLHYNLAAAHFGDGTDPSGIDAAVQSYRRAIELDPTRAESHYNLAIALEAQGAFGPAVEAYRAALERAPAHRQAYNNLGNALALLGRWDETIACYRAALAIAPEDASIHYNLGMALLRSGAFGPGWAECEWRFSGDTRESAKMPAFSKPLWTGDATMGRRLLLWPEQGFGDSIQFIRFVAPLRQLGYTLSFACRPELQRLFQSIDGLGVISEGAPYPPYDAHCPLMSVPHRLGTSLAAIPADIPYLRADPDAREAWRQRLSGLVGRKVGVVWRGSPTHIADRSRSMEAGAIAGFLDVPGVAVVSLQKEATAAELQILSRRQRVFDASAGLIDYAETAALIDTLDLVIAVDTSVCHLAGALGKPVWTLLAFNNDWRWLIAREDTPWYPTMRLFRQAAPGDWSGVVDRVRTALADFMGRAAPVPRRPESP